VPSNVMFTDDTSPFLTIIATNLVTLWLLKSDLDGSTNRSESEQSNS